MIEESRSPPTQLGQYAREIDLSPVQEEICRRVMEGESVRSICRDEHMPCRSTVLNWLAADPTFRVGYSLAKQLLAETLAERILKISDDATRDWVDTPDGKLFDHEHVQRSRLRVDSCKWLAGKLAPKRYGASLLRIDSAADEKRAPSPEQIAVRLSALANAASQLKEE